MTRTVKLGLVGTGLTAELLYLPAWKRLADRIEVVACTNRTRSKAVRFAKIAGIATVVDTAEELFALPEVEKVVISTPIEYLPRYVLAGLAASKAVLSEKPIAATPAEARKLIKAAAEYSHPWMVGENLAFVSHAHKLKAWIDAGRLGDIRFAEVRQLEWMGPKVPFFNTDWRAAPSYPGGFITDGGVHIANVVRRCMGDPVTVKSILGSFNPVLRPFDTAVAALQFESGALGTWTSCFTAHGDWPWLRVFGSKANAEWRRNDVTLTTGERQDHQVRESRGWIHCRVPTLRRRCCQGCAATAVAGREPRRSASDRAHPAEPLAQDCSSRYSPAAASMLTVPCSTFVGYVFRLTLMGAPLPSPVR